MRWLIAEDALRDRKGHWFEYIRSIRDGLVRLGDEVTVLADHQADSFIIEQLDARPVLPPSIWHRMMVPDSSAGCFASRGTLGRLITG